MEDERNMYLVVYFAVDKDDKSGWGNGSYLVLKPLTGELVRELEAYIAGTNDLRKVIIMNIIPLADDDKEDADGR